MNTKGGNLLKLKRHDAAGTIIDSMSYFYTLNAQQKLVNNKLNSVRDTGSTAAGMPLGRSSYVYDHDGRLARDMKENLNMRWTIDNKLRQVQKGNRFIRYWYDASGQRVMKRLHGDTVDYVFRDGTGNELERITRRNNSSTPILVKAETNIYGSSRIGVHELPTTATPDTVEQRASNSHTYELTDHLGNVRATVGDRKVFTAITGGYSLSALVRSASDIYPYGMPISTRSFSANTYRFGFNTQEKSTEINSSGSHTTALFWEYDSRTGRRWNLDPVVKFWESGYATFGNNPLFNIDPLGLDGEPVNKGDGKGKKGEKAINGGTKNGDGSISDGNPICKGCGADGEDIYGLPEKGSITKKEAEPSPGQSIRDGSKSGSDPSLGDFGTGLGLAGEGMWLFGENRSTSLYQQGFRRGLSGNYQLKGRNLSLFRNHPMTSVTKPITRLAPIGKTLSGAGTALSVVSLGFDVADYSSGDLSGSRLSYRVTGTGASIGAAYFLGGPYGAAFGGLFFLSEKTWDMTQPLRDEISQQYWQFENALRNGWRPR